MPAGWYPDHSGTDQLRWWDGETWGDEVRPLVIDMVPDFSSLTADDASLVSSEHALSTLALDRLAYDRLAHDRLAPTPEPSVPAPTATLDDAERAPLTRRQLRELLGGPLTTDAPR